MRKWGYNTYWYGKWHLSNSCDLDPYGFSGGTCPSPNGANGQGLRKDPQIVDQFLQWLQTSGHTTPWCTTVSLVNPHDITWYYLGTDQVPGEDNPPSVITAMPPNFESPTDLRHQHKPSLQLAFQKATDAGVGSLPYHGGGFETGWLKCLNLYLQLQQYVDTQIGRVLDALDADPTLSQNTIIIFMADHGDYAGSHGMRGKGCAGYDEAIRVPLYVKDPTGQWTANTDIDRTALTSSVDILPLLLTLGSGSTAWQSDPYYAHLTGRLDLTPLLADPNAAGRSYILQTSDEDYVESPLHGNFTQHVPSHVIAYRTAAAKLGVYSFWSGYDLTTTNQESELYDYSTQAGQQETQNVATSEPDLYNQMYSDLMDNIYVNELRAPLPDYLQPIQQAGLDAYLAYENRS